MEGRLLALLGRAHVLAEPVHLADARLLLRARGLGERDGERLLAVGDDSATRRLQAAGLELGHDLGDLVLVDVIALAEPDLVRRRVDHPRRAVGFGFGVAVARVEFAPEHTDARAVMLQHDAVAVDAVDLDVTQRAVHVDPIPNARRRERPRGAAAVGLEDLERGRGDARPVDDGDLAQAGRVPGEHGVAGVAPLPRVPAADRQPGVGTRLAHLPERGVIHLDGDVDRALLVVEPDVHHPPGDPRLVHDPNVAEALPLGCGLRLLRPLLERRLGGVVVHDLLLPVRLLDGRARDDDALLLVELRKREEDVHGHLSVVAIRRTLRHGGLSVPVHSLVHGVSAHRQSRADGADAGRRRAAQRHSSGESQGRGDEPRRPDGRIDAEPGDRGTERSAGELVASVSADEAAHALSDHRRRRAAALLFGPPPVFVARVGGLDVHQRCSPYSDRARFRPPRVRAPTPAPIMAPRRPAREIPRKERRAYRSTIFSLMREKVWVALICC